MSSIYVIGPEPVQATLLNNRIATYCADASVQSLLFNELEPNVLHHPTHAFIIMDSTTKAYAMAEQIRLHAPHCYITFVLTTPDRKTIQLFNEHSVSYISLPLTSERYAELMTKASHPDAITSNANGIDQIVHSKLKRYIRLL